MDQKCCGHENIAIIFALQPQLFFQKIDSPFDNLMSQDGFIYNYVGWWIGFNKGSDGIDNIDMGLGDIIEGPDTKNQVDPSHGASISNFTILVHGGDILYKIYFFLGEVGHRRLLSPHRHFTLHHFLSPLLNFPRPLLKLTEFLFLVWGGSMSKVRPSASSIIMSY